MLMAEQTRYLETVRSLIRARLAKGSLTPEDRRAVLRELERRYPGYVSVASISTLPELNVDAVASELAREHGR